MNIPTNNDLSFYNYNTPKIRLFIFIMEYINISANFFQFKNN